MFAAFSKTKLKNESADINVFHALFYTQLVYFNLTHRATTLLKHFLQSGWALKEVQSVSGKLWFADERSRGHKSARASLARGELSPSADTNRKKYTSSSKIPKSVREKAAKKHAQLMTRVSAENEISRALRSLGVRVCARSSICVWSQRGFFCCCCFFGSFDWHKQRILGDPLIPQLSSDALNLLIPDSATCSVKSKGKTWI